MKKKCWDCGLLSTDKIFCEHCGAEFEFKKISIAGFEGGVVGTFFGGAVIITGIVYGFDHTIGFVESLALFVCSVLGGIVGGEAFGTVVKKDNDGNFDLLLIGLGLVGGAVGVFMGVIVFWVLLGVYVWVLRLLGIEY